MNYVHQLWQQYLQLTALTEERMHPDQLRETKRAFYGACGQMLIFQRDKVAELSEEDAVNALQLMLDEIGDFWLKENDSHN